MASKVDEFIVKLSKPEDECSYSVLKFNGSQSADVTQWKNITLERENNQQTHASSVAGSSEPTQGRGSEFGKQEREIARRRKLGYRIDSGYKVERQPWVLTQPAVGETKEKKYKGVREGGIGDHSDYWIFVKAADGVFTAHPVSEWYNFIQIARYKTLDVDEAEEQYAKRSRILNQFAVMKNLGPEAEDEKPVKGAFKFRITDGGGKNSDSEEEEDKDEKDIKDASDAVEKSGLGGKKKKKPVKKEKPMNEDDLIVTDDSDDGDEEGREVDYMSDSESSDSDEGAPLEEKTAEQLTAVSEMDGLRKIMLSDDEDEDEEDQEIEGGIPNKNDPGNEDENTNDGVDAKQPSTSGAGTGTPDGRGSSRAKGDVNADDKKDSSSEDSDSDDPDSLANPLFLQKKEVKKENNGSKPAAQEPGKSLKRKDVDRSAAVGVPSKRPRKDLSGPMSINEEEVRRYLERKPHSCKDLASRFKSRVTGLSNKELVNRLGAVLKKLKPELDSFKKEGVTLYFLKDKKPASMKP